VLRAAQGMRDGESGIESITDESTKSGLRLAARRIQFTAPVVAMILTAISLWLAHSVL
jgi:hypothetical protein